jgi:hypothetical protein
LECITEKIGACVLTVIESSLNTSLGRADVSVCLVKCLNVALRLLKEQIAKRYAKKQARRVLEYA